MPLTKITGGEFDNTQGGLSVAGIITASSNLLVSGNLGLGINNPSYKLDVNGPIRYTDGQINSTFTCERTFNTPSIGAFANGVANQAFDVRTGNIAMWGYIEIEITGTYNNQNTPGILRKVFAIGINPSNAIYTNQSRVAEAMGAIVDNISIGEFQWDATNTTYKIPISHIVSTGNGYVVKVRAFTYGQSQTIYDNLSLSSVYTLTALSANDVTYPTRNVLIGTQTATGTASQPLQVSGGAYFNGLVGLGTTNPTVGLQLSPTASISNVGFGITLPGTVGSTLTVAQFVYGNANASYLRIKATRNTNGSDWTTASTKLVNVIDVTEQGYIEFNPNGSNYGMAFGQGTTEWARFDSSGRLGLGKTPIAQFDIGLTGTTNIATTTITKVTDFGTSASFGFGGLVNNNDGVFFGMGAGGGNGIPAGIGFMREASGWNTALAFYTNNVTSGPNSTNAMQEKMRIDSSGNLQLSTANTSILNSSGRKILNQTGSILQVVQTVKSDVFGTSSTSYIDVTGFNATITPSSTSSRILIFVTGSAGVSGAVTGGIQLLRGSTPICVGNTLSGYTSSSGPNFYSGSSDGNNNEAFAIHYLDSPATTSATTYKLQVYAPQGGNLYVNTLGSFISGQVYSMVTASTITLMEVSG